MKNLSILFLLFLFVFPAMGQGHEHQKVTVPETVLKTFQKDFPQAKDVEWGKEEDEFEAEFKINGVETSANYDQSGNRTELEVDIKNSELPASAMNYIKEKYSGYQIKESARVTDNKNVMTFEVQVKSGKEKKELVFDKDGKFLKENKGEED